MQLSFNKQIRNLVMDAQANIQLAIIFDMLGDKKSSENCIDKAHNFLAKANKVWDKRYAE